MLAISSMESYPVGKESLSSGQGPLTLRKKVLGARDRGATAAERHAQQERRMPLPKITELAVTWPKQAGSGLLAAFLHLTPLVTHTASLLTGHASQGPPGRKGSGERGLCLSHFPQESSG